MSSAFRAVLVLNYFFLANCKEMYYYIIIIIVICLKINRVCSAVHISAIFCNSSMFIVSGIFSTVNLIPFFITPSAPITTGSAVVFIFHILFISISKSVYFILLKIRSYPSFLVMSITFDPHKI